MKREDGLEFLIQFLDKHLKKDELADSLEKFEEFEDFHRKEGQSIAGYIVGMGITKKIVSRYIMIRDQRIAIRITIRITRFNFRVRMVLLCFQLK